MEAGGEGRIGEVGRWETNGEEKEELSIESMKQVDLGLACSGEERIGELGRWETIGEKRNNTMGSLVLRTLNR